MAVAISSAVRAGLSVTEAAVSLGVSVRKIWSEISTGKLRAVRCGRRTLVRPEDLAAYVDGLPEAGPRGR